MPVDLIPLEREEDVLLEYRETPVGRLLLYHNLGDHHLQYKRAPLLIITCMDHRIKLIMPRRFAYVIRTAGANVQEIDFNISFAIAVEGVRAICIIGHDDCTMVNVLQHRQDFINGLEKKAGWSRPDAGGHFDHLAREHAIIDSPEFIFSEAPRLSALYPGIQVAPLYYRVSDGALFQLDERKRSKAMEVHNETRGA